MSLRNLIIAIALGVALAGGVFVAANLNKPAQLKVALALPTPIALPEFTLYDQNGDAVTANSFRGQWDMVFFGFTHCPDVCPVTLQLLADVKRELAKSGMTATPRIVLVSVDPERDTPAVMGRYVDYFGEGNVGVSGDLDELRKLTTALGIFFEKVASDGDDYNVNHSAAVLLINPQGEFSALFSAPHQVENYLHDLPILMGSN